MDILVEVFCVTEFVLPAAELLDFLAAADVAAVTAVVVDFPAALKVVVAGLAAGFIGLSDSDTI